jgi:hypothetical protein
MNKLPMQPVEFDDSGVLRFRGNKVVEYLFETRAINLNTIPTRALPAEDVEQFWQMLGYSLSGYQDLSFIREETKRSLDVIRDDMLGVPPRAVEAFTRQVAVAFHRGQALARQAQELVEYVRYVCSGKHPGPRPSYGPLTKEELLRLEAKAEGVRHVLEEAGLWQKSGPPMASSR